MMRPVTGNSAFVSILRGKDVQPVDKCRAFTIIAGHRNLSASCQSVQDGKDVAGGVSSQL